MSSLRALALFSVFTYIVKREVACGYNVVDAAAGSHSTVTQVLTTLTDGDVNTCAKTMVENSELKIDLGRNRTVAKIKVFIAEAVGRFVVYGGQSTTYQSGNVCYDGGLSQTGSQGNTLTCISTVNSDHIYGWFNVSGRIHLCEIQAFSTGGQVNLLLNKNVTLVGARRVRLFSLDTTCATYRAKQLTILLHLPTPEFISSFQIAIPYGEANSTISILDTPSTTVGTCKSYVSLTAGDVQYVRCNTTMLGSHAKLVLDVVTDRIKICRIQVVPRIHGGWSNFTRDGPCSVTCGGGTQRAIRRCDNPRPQGTGNVCSGGYFRRLPCNTHSCTGDWVSWTSWSACSVTCGNGTRSRTRVCVNPISPADVNCTGETADTSRCDINCTIVTDNSETVSSVSKIWVPIVVPILAVLAVLLTVIPIVVWRRKKKQTVIPKKKKRKRSSVKSDKEQAPAARRKSAISLAEADKDQDKVPTTKRKSTITSAEGKSVKTARRSTDGQQDIQQVLSVKPIV